MDLWAGVGALSWALVCLPDPALEAYCSGQVAFAFAMAALARGINSLRKSLPAA
jgi:hypothetical protein